MHTSEIKKPSPLSIWAAMISIYFVWGSTYLAIRFAVETIPPFMMAAARFLVAGGILYLWRRLRGDPRPSRLEWRSAAIIGGFLLVGGNGCVVWAEQRVFSGITSLIVASAPLWIALIDRLVLSRLASTRQRYPPLTALGVVVGFVGIVLLVGPGQLIGLSGSASGGVDPLGGGVLLLGSLLWSIGSLYTRHARLPASPLLGTGMEMLAGGAGLLLLSTLTGEWARLDLAAIAPQSAWGLVYLIFFGALVGFGAYTWLLRVAPTSLVSTYAYVNPVVAIFVGNLLAQEPLSPRVVIAAVVILGAVALITLTQPASRK